MQIELLGGMSIGLVWGWCLGFWNTGEAKNRRGLNALASALAALPLAALNQAFAGWHATAYFAVAVVLSLVIHLAWRYYLRRKVTS